MVVGLHLGLTLLLLWYWFVDSHLKTLLLLRTIWIQLVPVVSDRFSHVSTIFCGRARARPQTNLAFGGQRHVLKAYRARADLKENFGTFLAFLCSSNWNEWYVNKRRSKGPGVEFKLRDMGHVFHVNISKCTFPTHKSRPAFTRPSNKTFITRAQAIGRGHGS